MTKVGHREIAGRATKGKVSIILWQGFSRRAVHFAVQWKDGPKLSDNNNLNMATKESGVDIDYWQRKQKKWQLAAVTQIDRLRHDGRRQCC